MLTIYVFLTLYWTLESIFTPIDVDCVYYDAEPDRNTESR